MIQSVSILGFARSLRKNRYNKAVLHAAKDLARKNVDLEIFDSNGIPLLNQDLENIVP